jgi:putative phosphoribosyl transferase
MIFASRQNAGYRLGIHLQEQGVFVDIAAGLPRGGVIVAAEVARVLHCPLDVLVVRKIGHPLHREFAVGALAEEGVVLLDEASIEMKTSIREQLNRVIEEERLRFREYENRFHSGESHDFTNKAVLLVDDGLATGATTEAAVLSARKQGAHKIIVAAPVASTGAVRRLSRVADQVIVLHEDPDFDAVGRYYEMFSQTTDDEVVAVLKAEHAAP